VRSAADLHIDRQELETARLLRKVLPDLRQVRREQLRHHRVLHLPLQVRHLSLRHQKLREGREVFPQVRINPQEDSRELLPSRCTDQPVDMPARTVLLR
jgi:hypothetical protein